MREINGETFYMYVYKNNLCLNRFCYALAMQAVFLFYCASYTPVKYGNDYFYPKWAEGMGLCMSLASMIWVPGIYMYTLPPPTLYPCFFA